MTPTLTRAAFAAWLAQFADEAEVGFSGNPNACPLANYLTDSTGQQCDYAFVESTGIHMLTAQRAVVIRDVAEWIVAFIGLVDDDDVITHQGAITAGTAREILACIPDDEAQP